PYIRDSCTCFLTNRDQSPLKASKAIFRCCERSPAGRARTAATSASRARNFSDSTPPAVAIYAAPSRSKKRVTESLVTWTVRGSQRPHANANARRLIVGKRSVCPAATEGGTCPANLTHTRARRAAPALDPRWAPYCRAG